MKKKSLSKSYSRTKINKYIYIKKKIVQLAHSRTKSYSRLQFQSNALINELRMTYESNFQWLNYRVEIYPPTKETRDSLILTI